MLFNLCTVAFPKPVSAERFDSGEFLFEEPIRLEVGSGNDVLFVSHAMTILEVGHSSRSMGIQMKSR